MRSLSDRTVTADDRPSVMRTLRKLPSLSSDLYGDLGRYAGGVVLACFEQMGGLDAMAEWARRNPGEFYTKVYPKVIQASKHVEADVKLTVDDVITTLEATAAPLGAGGLNNEGNGYYGRQDHGRSSRAEEPAEYEPDEW